MYHAARIVGECVRRVSEIDRASLERDNFSFNVNLLLGGQIRGEAPTLYLIYPQGNPLQATEDSPYLQLGECKYGRPILDRGIRPATSLEVAAKYALLSFDATMRSNVTVGPPIDLLLYKKDSLRDHAVPAARRRSIPILNLIHASWEQSLRRAVEQLPEIQFDEPPEPDPRPARRAGRSSWRPPRVASGPTVHEASMRRDSDPARPCILDAQLATLCPPARLTSSPATRCPTPSTRCSTARRSRAVLPQAAQRAAQADARGAAAEQAAGGPLLLQPGHHLHRLRPQRGDRAHLPARPAAAHRLGRRLGRDRARPDPAHHRAQPVPEGHLPRAQDPARRRRPARAWSTPAGTSAAR